MPALGPVLGPYSRAVWAGNTLYMAGQLGLDPATGKLVEGGVAAETELLLKGVSAVLAAAGLSMANVVKANVFLTDMNDFAAMNKVYESSSKRLTLRAAQSASRRFPPVPMSKSSSSPRNSGRDGLHLLPRGAAGQTPPQVCSYETYFDAGSAGAYFDTSCSDSAAVFSSNGTIVCSAYASFADNCCLYCVLK